ncbi:MAG: hypothetical protein LBU70_08205 [Chitinispirillales bacterium]|jgi:dolichol kinase|nr:hypothetical protein [Chitinispirillales bacterium]
MALRKEEITRKLLHLFALLMPAGIFYLPDERLAEMMGFAVPYAVPVGILAFLFFGSVIVEQVRFRVPAVQKIFYKCFGHMLRQEEDAKITGSTYVIGAALICSLIFINHRHISMMALTLFILGDAIAAVVGLSVGRIKIGKKSLEGSTACFTLCMILFYALFPHLPWVLDAWGGTVNVWIALAAAFSITIFELIPLKITNKLVINDNLAVPVITGGIMLLMEGIIS